MPFSFESNLYQLNSEHVPPSFLGSEGLPANVEKHTLTETGVLLLDSMGMVVFADQTANQHCERGEGISVEAGTLQIRTCDGRFQGRHLYRFARKSERAVHFIPRTGRLPFEIRFLPLPAAHQAGSLLVCLVRDEEQERSTQLRLLCLQYRLSPSELQLCFLIRDGHSLSEAAIQLSTTYNAVRARLKRVFEKTGVQRQTDLVRLLLYRSALEVRFGGAHTEPDQSVSLGHEVTTREFESFIEQVCMRC
jgi:DNA-binding CsgD family transcriptional regulator